jgi:xylulokinase
MEIMKEIGIHPSIIRAGWANMFLSQVFRETLAEISGATIELYDTDGSIGAANGAGVGSGVYASFEEAFENLNMRMVVEATRKDHDKYSEAYGRWKEVLEKCITG